MKLEENRVYKIYFKWSRLKPVVARVYDKFEVSKIPGYRFGVLKGNLKFKFSVELLECKDGFFTPDGAEVLKIKELLEYAL